MGLFDNLELSLGFGCWWIPSHREDDGDHFSLINISVSNEYDGTGYWSGTYLIFGLLGFLFEIGLARNDSIFDNDRF